MKSISPALRQAGSLHDLQHGGPELGRRGGHGDSRLVHGLDLRGSGALAARNDGAGVSHASAGGCRETCNETNDGLLVAAGAEPLSSLLLCGASDLTNHNDTFSLRVADEVLQAVEEVGAVERVTTNANASGLAKPSNSGLVHSLVRQGARPRNDANLALLVDITRHDTDLALAGLDDAWAVRSDKTGRGLRVQGCLDPNHILLWDALGDANHQGNLSLEGLQNRGGSSWRRDIDHTGVGLDGGLCLLDGVEHGQVKVGRPSLARRHSTNHVRAVLNGMGAVERALLSRETLAENLGGLADGRGRRPILEPRDGGGEAAARAADSL
mmetsp:Transcript_19353/g.45283  ORF Transcript_19353/g.45283 Transcript_19353/m.45283 type:complete len:326 (-) Transcript_19353:31-1008(-)